jgi:hypothetical protein
LIFGTFFIRFQFATPPKDKSNSTLVWMDTVHRRVRINKEYQMYVPSSELGLSQPLPRQRVCPSPPEPGREPLPAGEGLGESQFRRLEKSLALCLLCAVQLLGNVAKCFIHNSSNDPLSRNSYLRAG